MVRTLLFSTLYPSSERPGHGIFVEARLRELLAHGGVQTRVVAPVPWFHSRDERHGERAAMARTPARETWNGIDVWHPRYLLIPKLGMTLAPLALALGARPVLQALRDDGFAFDLIDAHYFYPDGVAAALLARWFGTPFVVTARGSDVNLIAKHAAPRRMMRWAAQRAAACIGVSRALADRLLALGAPQQRVRVMRNGVDAQRFRPEAQAIARQRLALPPGPLLLSVGNLLQVKRHDLAIQALQRLRQVQPTARLVIVGRGPLHGSLLEQARTLGLAGAVDFPGAVEQSELRWWYSAADLLVLASSREGWPNVLLEAMACGLPVLASKVGGVAEIVCDPVLGTAVDIGDAADLAQAMAAALASTPDRAAIRQHALRMTWEQTSQDQLALFEGLSAAPSPQTAAKPRVVR